MSEWQDISTAPKDGSIVLGFFPNMWVAGGDYADKSRLWGMCAIRWDGYDEDWGWHTLDADTLGKPTHWMLMPEPPKP